MEPVTLGLMLTSLVAKEALEAAAGSAGKAGWELLARLSRRVRSWVAGEGDEEALSALDAVVDNPESKGRALILAEVLEVRLRNKPDIALELQALLEEVEASADETVRAFVINVRENAKVGEVTVVSGSQVVVSGSQVNNLVAGDQPISLFDRPIIAKEIGQIVFGAEAVLPTPVGSVALDQGCYLLQWRPAFSRHGDHFDGTMRVHVDGNTTTASGDLYAHPPAWAPGHWQSPEPVPSAGIPCFPRSLYRYYLSVTGLFQVGDGITVEWELHELDRLLSNSWTDRGAYTAELKWQQASTDYPRRDAYLSGQVKRRSDDTAQGSISLGWVSPYLRRATIEISTVAPSEPPLQSESGLGWQDVFGKVGWEVSVVKSDANVPIPGPVPWKDSECHMAMLALKDRANLDAEWRYHILCVPQLESTSRGLVYDPYGGDSSNLPTGVAVLASHWQIPTAPLWGNTSGDRFGTSELYFRSAVHQIGHAMGLYDNTVNNGFMNTTSVILKDKGVFPNNIQWDFAPDDTHRLRHMPDPMVRPSALIRKAPNAPSIGSTWRGPLSDYDILDASGIGFEVEPLLEVVPIGAPVRVELSLSNYNDVPVKCPASLSLRRGHVSGRVIDMSGSTQTFWPLVMCVDEDELVDLDPGDFIPGSITLLRGPDGPLFTSPGLFEVVVEVVWEVGARPVGVRGSCFVFVTGAQTNSHASAAAAVLAHPDVHLSIAIGGDHLLDALMAIQACLNDDVLRPHWAAIEAILAGNRFGRREAQIGHATELLSHDPVMSHQESSELHDLID